MHTQTVAQARAKLRDALVAGESSTCPCCDQFVKLYRRKLNAGMAHSLVVLWKHARSHFVHVPTVVGRESADQALLRYWELIEAHPEQSGYWRVTELGEQFVTGQITVPSHVLLYNNRFLGLDGDSVSIQDCLGRSSATPSSWPARRSVSCT